MWSFLFFLSIFPIFSQDIEVSLPPVEIESQMDGLATARTVDWTVIQEKPLPSINLPQPEDSLNTFNGLQVRTQGSPTFSIRGSEQSGRALVLYDHIPLNFASGVGAPNIFFAKENIDNAIVVKGPASLFYGSQAMGGAVDFIPRKFKESEININFSDTDESFLPWRDGSLAHQSYQLATPLYQSNKTHVQSTVFYEDDDGQYPFQTADQSGVRGFNSQNLSRGTLEAETSWEYLQIKFNALGGKQVRQFPGSVDFPSFGREETEGGLFSLTPHFFFSEQTSLRSRISYLKNDSKFFQNNQESYTKSQTTIVQNEWLYDLSRFTKLQVFGDFFFHRLDSSFAGDGLSQDNSELGPFLNFNTFNFLKHQVGGRYLFRNQKFLPSLSNHFYFSGLDAWLSYAQGFRNPTLFDLYSSNPQFVGNPNLVAESSEQFEIGIKNEKKQRLNWDLRFFHVEYSDFLETLNISPGVLSKENQGTGFSRGFDVDFNWNLLPFVFDLNYNYLDTKNRSQNRSFRISPRHQLNLTAAYHWYDLLFEVQNSHWYKVYDVDPFTNQAVQMEDWQQWNFFLHWSFLQKSQISFGLVNAFNESKELTLGYPEPQRKYWVRFQQRF